MARLTRIGIGLWALAAGALAVSLLAPEREPEGWFSYVPLSSHEFTPSTGHPALDPTLWLGIAIGLAVAGAVVLVAEHGRRPGSNT